VSADVDVFDGRLALGARGLLREFNDAGVLAAADVHVARRLAALAGEDDETVTLAVALAVRGPRLGHTCVDLATIRETATVDADEPVDLTALGWPEPGEWVARVARSELVAFTASDAVDATRSRDADASPLAAGAFTATDAVDATRPLRLAGTVLYLDRYWREEDQVAADLQTLAAGPAGDVDPDLLADGVRRLFGDQAGGRQARAAEAAVRRRFAVVGGGPGTGKTTTVARIVALLAEQAGARGVPPPLVALAAPTGKAAARLQEAVHEQAAELDVDGPIRDGLLALRASTLHRLLGWRPGSHSRFRHHRGNRLPHDVVVVDETSMVSLSLMARLAEAVRPDARLILVGDPGQLTSIEAGAVLGDIVGPMAADPASGAHPGVADGIVILERVHRYGGGIGRLAQAIRAGDPDAALDALTGAPGEVTWIDADAAEPPAGAAIRSPAIGAARAVIDAARAGDAPTALEALGAFRLLCAHRRGPYGVETWMARIEAWLADGIDGFGAEGEWYAGRPLLVLSNDYGLQLYNGDTGVVIATGAGRVSAAFERQGGVLEFRPARLAAVDTVYAMTVHKSQGSQFATAAVVLPDPASPLLTRELLYTAITRARERLILVGTEAAVRTAVARPVARASGLRARLWGEA
jgi:exodeoxyribonuclease V alpha subunit